MPNGSSQLSGIPAEILQQRLTEAQTALHNLLTGQMGESYSFNAGLGGKSVTYSRADLPQLRTYIAELRIALGLPSGRRAMRFKFR